MKHCSVQNCTNKYHAKGFCDNHYRLWRRHGDPLIKLKPKQGSNSPNWKNNKITYTAMHYRIRKELGRALMYSCTDCNNPAYDWSLNNTTNALNCPDTGLLFSLNINDYSPRCRSCHKNLDLRQNNG